MLLNREICIDMSKKAWVDFTHCMLETVKRLDMVMTPTDFFRIAYEIERWHVIVTEELAKLQD